MTCITYETVNAKDPGLVRCSVQRAGGGSLGGSAPERPLHSWLASCLWRALAAPFRAYARWRDRARADADFRMIDVRTLDDIGLVRSGIAAVGAPDNENAPRGDVA